MEGKLATVPLLQELGLSDEVIAEKLQLPFSDVQRVSMIRQRVQLCGIVPRFTVDCLSISSTLLFNDLLRTYLRSD